MAKPRKHAHWYVLAAQVVIITLLAVRSSHLAAAADEFDPPSRVARLSYLHGPVSFQPAGEAEWVGAVANRPLTTGDRLWTDRGARAELVTGSATFRLDADTDFAFTNLDDRIVQAQLTQGTITVRVLRLRGDEAIEVDTPNQAFSILREGTYRLEASEDGDSTLVTVRAGEGEAAGDGDSYLIHSGQSTRLSGVDRLRVTDVRMGRVDEFDEWGLARDRRVEASVSARHVSRDVVGYEDLDEYGTWRSNTSYGDVWIPTRTAAGWAPYHDGHWAWISPWGYTWVDDAPWGYAPFHYGRWVTIEGRWGWVPGPVEVEAVYAPALVAFIGGPSFGLSVSIGGGGPGGEVGWFPLGPREVYVPGYRASRGYVDRVNVSNTRVTTTNITNVYNTQVINNFGTTSVKYVNREAPGGVTVVPQQAFVSAKPVARAAVKVDARRITAAPVGPTAAVAPTRDAVFGTTKLEGAPRPPPAVTERTVFTRTPPPPPPVPFARQEKALEASRGRPLVRQEVESVRAQAPAARQSPARQAFQGKPGAEPSSKQAPPAVVQPETAKPEEKATLPQATKPEEQVAQPQGRPKPEEKATLPRATKPEEQVAQPQGRPKPEEKATLPRATKPEERVAQPQGRPKPEEKATLPRVTKPEERVAQPPPKAAARAPRRVERTPLTDGAKDKRPDGGDKEKRDGQLPTEEKTPR
jgi:hypothetical protein